MKRSVVISVVGVLALVLAGLAVNTAAADPTVSVPFQGMKLLPKKCKNPGSYRVVKTVKRAPRESDTPNWHWVETTQSTTGHLRTQTYVKNSYRNFEVGILCNGEHNKYRITDPVTYVHKTRNVYLNCYGGGCQLLYTRTSDWTKGYCMRGEDGKVCVNY